MVQLVRVCRSCRHVNLSEDSQRCSNCWFLLTDIEPVPLERGVRLARRRRIRIRRPLLLFLLCMVLGLMAWWLYLFFALDSLLFPSPSATSAMNPAITAQSWPQGRRTAENSGYTPEEAPRPTHIKWRFKTTKSLFAGPAVTEDSVYLSTEDGRTVALHRDDGEPRWEYQSGLPSGSIPAVADHIVVSVVRSGLITALDKNTGEKLWGVNVNGPIYASPVIVDGTVYIGAGNDHLYALDVVNGKERWTFDAGDWIVSSVAYTDEALVVMTQFSDVFLVDPATGRKLLFFDTGYVRFGGGPVIYEDQAYFPSDRGWVWSIDRLSTGFPLERVVWWLKLNLYVWNLLDENPVQKGGLWSYQLGGDVKFTAAAAHDNVYMTNLQGQVFARNAMSGEERWTADAGVGITTPPTVAGRTVLFGTIDGRIVGLDAHDGHKLWDFGVGDQITASPIVAGNTIYAVTSSGVLYAISGSR